MASNFGLYLGWKQLSIFKILQYCSGVREAFIDEIYPLIIKEGSFTLASYSFEIWLISNETLKSSTTLENVHFSFYIFYFEIDYLIASKD
jgi:hypothetical protein